MTDRWGLLRAVSKVLGFLFFIGVALIGLTIWIPSWASVLVRAVAVGLATVLAYLWTSKHFMQKIRASTNKPGHFHIVPRRNARELQEQITVAAEITLEQAEAFTTAIVDIAALRQRVVEQYAPDNRTLRQYVTVDMQLPRSTLAASDSDTPQQQSRFLIPVILPPKGELLDMLHVFGSDGNRLDTLSYREYLFVAATVLRTLLSVACGVAPSELPADVRTHETDAIWALISRADGRPQEANAVLAPVPPATRSTDGTASLAATGASADEAGPRGGHADAIGNLTGGVGATGGAVPEPETCPTAREIAKRIQGLSRGIVNRDALRMAAILVEVLSTHYAIVADVSVPEDGRFMIRYERTFIPDFKPPRPHRKPKASRSGLLRQVGAMLNVLFGTGTVDIRVSLDNAWTCQSYHAHVSCPHGLYLSHQELDAPEGYLDRRAKAAPTQPHIRFRRRLGQSYAHFYGRYLPMPRAGEQRPKLILDFQEMPPGSVFGAALSALAAAVLVWIIGFGVSRAPGATLSTDAPVVLLAFPGVAASWLGFDTASRRLFEGALTARLSLAVTALISIAATGLYLLRNARTPAKTTPQSAHHAMTVLGVTQLPWILLLVTALFNALYLTYRWLINSWRFNYFASRLDPGGMPSAVTGAYASSGTDVTAATTDCPPTPPTGESRNRSMQVDTP